MELEEQVVSLELAKELKELGYKQEGLWWWIKGKLKSNEWVEDQYQLARQENYFLKMEEVVAPTVAELGERLHPFEIVNDIVLHLGFTANCFWGEWRKKREVLFSVLEEKEADCRAKMWLYLIKEVSNGKLSKL